MSKTITLRLSDEEYEQIALSAEHEHRPISNFITHIVVKNLKESQYADSIEMAQINSDEKLIKKLKRGHKEAREIREKYRG
jgi:uncharacterized protein (DUF1778 family)